VDIYIDGATNSHDRVIHELRCRYKGRQAVSNDRKIHRGQVRANDVNRCVDVVDAWPETDFATTFPDDKIDRLLNRPRIAVVGFGSDARGAVTAALAPRLRRPFHPAIGR